jgi:hypothetical protein
MDRMNGDLPERRNVSHDDPIAAILEALSFHNHSCGDRVLATTRLRIICAKVRSRNDRESLKSGRVILAALLFEGRQRIWPQVSVDRALERFCSHVGELM